MNKIAKWVLTAATIAVVFLGATWAAGFVAHKRVAVFSDRVAEQSNGLLQVAERTSTAGYFSSIEDVTFAVATPLLSLAPGLQRGDGSKLQFTIHSVIAHGPFPNFRGVGVARVESSLVLDDATRKKLIELLGTDQPFAIAVTLGWLGGTQIDLTSPALTYRDNNNATSVTWKGMQARLDYSRDFLGMEFSGSVPGISLVSKTGGEFSIDNVQAKGDFKSKFDPLFVGDELITIASISYKMSEAKSGPFLAKDISYGVHAGAEKEFFSLSAKLGAASAEAEVYVFKDTHFDFGVNHLHGPTVAKLIKEAQNVRRTRPDGEPIALPSTDAMQAGAADLLLNQPELFVDRLALATKDGDLKISARAKLVDIATEDVKPSINFGRLTNKVMATADISVSQSLIDHWPGAEANTANIKKMISEFDRSGYLVRKGDRLETHFEFSKGALTANGKAVGK